VILGLQGGRNDPATILFRMRVLVHDSSGHPFQIELSRELARRGHEVLHIYCSSFLSPRGAMQRSEDDPEGFAVKDIVLSRPFERFSFGRYSPGRRLKQEFTYGGQVCDEVRSFKPDVLLSANGPLFSQLRIQRTCRGERIPFLLWLQDFYSVPMKAEARRRLGRAGSAIGTALEQAERLLVRRCRGIVTISEDFNPKLVGWGVDPAAIEVIHNWAPIADLPVRPKDNPWAVEHGLEDKVVFLYTGTLGLKHNPALLWAVAARLRKERAEGRVVVASEGTGMDWLRERLAGDPIDQLVLLPFQPFDRYADVLGAADVLLAILEPGAGAYAVPSKVLSYLCAGRPVLAAIPDANLAGRIVLDNQAGLVVRPDDEEAFVAAAMRLSSDDDLRRQFGRNGRRYAEHSFPITVIADRFEQLLAGAITRPGGS
jgi:glycosyltransferase involved in cell wall biosynthesis